MSLVGEGQLAVTECDVRLAFRFEIRQSWVGYECNFQGETNKYKQNSVTNNTTLGFQVSTKDEATTGSSLSDLWMDFLIAETTEDGKPPR